MVACVLKKKRAAGFNLLEVQMHIAGCSTGTRNPYGYQRLRNARDAGMDQSTSAVSKLTVGTVFLLTFVNVRSYTRDAK